jgi:TRAP-type C4-dicarboxylate transport system permease small subunit
VDIPNPSQGPQHNSQSWLAKIHKGLRWLTHSADVCIGFSLALLLAVVVVLNVIEIMLRATINVSLVWLYEINLLLATWIYFLGICNVYFKRGDITVDYLFDRMRTSWRKPVLIAINVLSLAVVFVFFYFGLLLIRLQWPYRTPGVQLPEVTYTLPLVLGSSIVALSLVEQTLDMLVLRAQR